MTEKEIIDIVFEQYPFVFRNNRGCLRTPSGGFIRFGIPEPKKRESVNDFKGSDLIGFNSEGRFSGIEIKTLNDKLKEGQIKWHNFLLEHNCLSEIWQETKSGIVIIRGKI